MQVRHTIAALAITFTAFELRPLAAQIDYRNLDDRRPVRTEDAYPIERFAFELVVPYEYENRLRGEHLHVVAPELSYGLLPNTQVGLELPLAALDEASGTEWGFGGPRLFALYSFNTEGRTLPALALRTDVALPFGDLGADDAQLTLQGIATRSWGLTRLHLNAAATLGRQAGRPMVDAEPRWALSLAADRTLLRQSLLAVGEVEILEETSDAPTEIAAAFGVRYQLTPTLVLDAGVRRRLSADAGPDLGLTFGLSHAFALAGLLPGGRDEGANDATAARPGALAAQDPRDEQFYYPGDFNWRFLALYPEAARLFNAFDYGHSVLYETLLTEGERASPALAKEYRYLTTDLLVRPPRFAIAEEAVMPSYAKTAWQAKQMFDWAHVLHRQIYDVYADDRIAPARKDALIERLTDYYLSRTEYAFTAAPKTMALMDEQPFSQVFRRTEPTFNGLIWAYHWLQVGLYEPMIAAGSRAETKAGLDAAVARFWEMVHSERYPTTMPMAAAVAPEFSRRHPRAAVIFDNLHMMHDIISDVLASPTIPGNRKREVIYQQLEEFRRPVGNVISMDDWRQMADHMGGIAAMGGPAVGLLRSRKAPRPASDSTVERSESNDHHRH